MSSRPSTATIEALDKLISFATVSQDSNLALIHWLQEQLSALGYRMMLVPDETGKKANLFASIGPEVDGGLVLSGHTDVVPIDGQDWHTDPFQMVEQDEKLFGRGTCDMKGFLACLLGKAEQIAQSELKVPVHFAFSYDEEIGCIGVRPLVDAMMAAGIKPAMCIIGEPTEMQVVNAHKGKHTVTCRVTGKSGHSSLPAQGVNAVEYAAEMIVYLRSMNKRFATEGPLDEKFDPPHTTVHTGPIRGGTQVNIIPEECSFDYEYRMLPGHDADDISAEIEDYVRSELEPFMHEIDPNTGFTLDVSTSFPGLDTPEDADVTKLVMQLTGANGTHAVSFGTEAGVFSMIGGIPSVVCGPGSITQAHKPNEWIALDQLARCEVFLDKLIDRMCRE